MLSAPKQKGQRFVEYAIILGSVAAAGLWQCRQHPTAI
jgi:hypothetical protein